MPLALIQPKPRVRVPAATRATGASAEPSPAGARLLRYLGTGATVARIGAGLAVITHPDHLAEAVAIEDLAKA